MDLGIPGEALDTMLKRLDAEGLLAALDRAVAPDDCGGEPAECRQALDSLDLSQLKQLVDQLKAACVGQAEADPAAAATLVRELAAVVAGLALQRRAPS